MPWSSRESHGYVVMHGLTRYIIADRIFEFLLKGGGWRIDNMYANWDACNWLCWLVLREGPRLFVEAWGSKEGKEKWSRFMTTE